MYKVLVSPPGSCKDSSLSSPSAPAIAVCFSVLNADYFY